MKGFSLKNETKCKRCCITIGAIIHLVLALLIGVGFAAWFANSYKIQDQFEKELRDAIRENQDLCDKYDLDCDVYVDDDLPNYYDNLPMHYLGSQINEQNIDQELQQMLSQNFGVKFDQSSLNQEHDRDTPNWYSSDDFGDAQQYLKDILENCGDDEDCLNAGNRFSKIYAFSGVTMILLALNSFCMLFGSCSYHVRGLTTICGALFSILNLAAIITTGVFRFNSWGKLSALCQGPSLYDIDDDGKLDLSNDWTVQSDAQVLVGLMVWQIIFLCSYSCFIGCTGLPSKQ